MLLMLSKRNEEKEIFNIVQNEMNGFWKQGGSWWNSKTRYTGISWCFRFIQTNYKNNSTGCFQVLYWKKLPYVVPLAAQSPIAVYKDMYGNIINDLYDTNPDYRIQNLHLCVFLLKWNHCITLLIIKG